MSKTGQREITEEFLDEFYSAIFVGSKESVSRLIESNSAAVNALILGMPALLYASSFGHLEIAKLLLEEKADINQQDYLGHTALREAAECGHDQVVAFLLDKGASGKTAVKELVKELLQADETIRFSSLESLQRVDALLSAVSYEVLGDELAANSL